MTRTEAIKLFLERHTHRDLASMYTFDMECQVIVSQDDGEIIEDEFKGVKWKGYTNGLQVWKPFRIPRNADSEPEYNDVELSFDMIHVEGIGMTGWDWVNRSSKWVAFDFDAITGHSEKHANKLEPEELAKIRDAACKIPWVTVRNSTSGSGLHLYVMLNDVPTQNHTEHAALGRAILSKMSALSGFDFRSKVDICGGNMWVWHRKMKGTNGLSLVKQGTILEEIPSNWKDHLSVIRNRSGQVKHSGDSKFDRLFGQYTFTKLDEDHMRLINWLNTSSEYNWWWDSDRHMLVTHTIDLKSAHEALDYCGIFETISEGKSQQNCFAFPLRRGSWVVRRYSLGVSEHPSWEQDGQGYTRCFYNRPADLKIAALASNGVEDPSGGYVFSNVSDAETAALHIGAEFKLPAIFDGRNVTIKHHKDGKRIIVELPHSNTDNPANLRGWLLKGKKWMRILNTNLPASQADVDAEDFEDLVRHVVSINHVDGGWVLNSQNQWHDEPLTHVKLALKSSGLNAANVDQVLGGSVLKPWKLVNLPFQPEYTGNREWNRHAAQLRFPPSNREVLNYPTWLSVLDHIGKCLDAPLARSKWARRNGILKGSDYLKCWIASLIQHPFEPLPYLFIHSTRQNTGKSTLHEAIALLFDRGCRRADSALRRDFNAEIESAVLCIIEETDLNASESAYNKIKDWVTSRVIPIHKKMLTPYEIPNTTHWIQCANQRAYCPVFPGDTRIVYLNVAEEPEKLIPKAELLTLLEKEAPDFITAILNLELPKSDDRLNLPVIETEDKADAMDVNRTPVEVFIKEKCHEVPGKSITLQEFYEAYIAWLDPLDRVNWSNKQKVSRAMPDRFPKGRLSGTSSWSWGNISFEPSTVETTSLPYYVREEERLVLKYPESYLQEAYENEFGPTY